MSEDPSEFLIPERVETGFLTAAVSEPEPVKLTLEAIEAMKHMVKLSEEQALPAYLMAVARDMGMNILTLDAIKVKHGLTNAQFDFLIAHNGFFIRAVEQQAQEWGSLSSAQDRLRSQAAAALEEQLPVLAARMGTRGEKLEAAVEAAKLFAKIAGVDAEPKSGAGGGSGFTITIDLGADQRITVGPDGEQNGGSKQIEQTALRSDAKGPSQLQQIQLLAQRDGTTE